MRYYSLCGASHSLVFVYPMQYLDEMFDRQSRQRFQKPPRGATDYQLDKLTLSTGPGSTYQNQLFISKSTQSRHVVSDTGSPMAMVMRELLELVTSFC